MHLDFLGHACVSVESCHQTLLIDPYEPGQFDGRMRYEAIDVHPDWVVCSHDHADHCAVDAVPGSPTVINARHVLSIPGFRAHSSTTMSTMGATAADRWMRSPSPRTVAAFFTSRMSGKPHRRRCFVWNHHRPDILLIPVGGFYTIGAAQAAEWIVRLAPRTTIPIHYRTSGCALPIRDLEAFRAWIPEAQMWNSRRIHVDDSLPDHLIVAPRLAPREIDDAIGDP